MGQDSVFLWLYIVTCSLFLFPLNHLGGALPSLCTLTHRHPLWRREGRGRRILESGNAVNASSSAESHCAVNASDDAAPIWGQALCDTWFGWELAP